MCGKASITLGFKNAHFVVLIHCKLIQCLFNIPAVNQCGMKHFFRVLDLEIERTTKVLFWFQDGCDIFLKMKN